MAATTESLNILIKAKDLYSKELTKMQKSFQISGAAIAGSLLAVGGVLAKISKDTAALGDQFQKMALRTNVSTQTLSEMAHVAELAGTNIQTVEKGIFRMTKVANDASQGLGEAKETLELLGISAKDTNGQLKNTEQLFFESIQALRQVKDETQRVALAQEIFGKSGVQLLTIVNQTNEAIGEQRQEAINLGITFDQISANEAAQFNDDMLRLSKSVRGLTIELGKGLIPFLSKSAAGWVEIIKQTKEFLGITDSSSKSIMELSKLIYQKEQLMESFERRARFASILDKKRFEGRAEDLREEIKLLQAVKDAKIASEPAQIETPGKGKGTGGKGGGLDNKKQEQLEKELALEAAALDQSLLQLQEKNEEEREIMLAQDAFMEEARQNDIAAEKAAIAFKRKLNVDAGKNAISLLESLNTIADGKNRAVFDALKLARAGEAIVNTYAGANQAMASLPYPYNLVAAGTVIAAGLANLAVIQRTQFGGGSTGGGSTTAAITPTSLTTPSQTGVTGSQQTQPQNITIEINGVLNADDVVQLVEDEIIPAINTSLDRNASTLNVRY